MINGDVNDTDMKRNLLFGIIMFLAVGAQAAEREKLNFNGDWCLKVGDVAEALNPEYDDSGWQRVTLPYAFNGDEAFRRDIVDLTDTICWYRKSFCVDGERVKDGKFFIEFEGVRQGADFYLNGHHLGFSENVTSGTTATSTPTMEASRRMCGCT